MKKLKRPLSLLLALLLCFGSLAGLTTAHAAESMIVHMVQLPRNTDPNKGGWDYPALSFLGGWSLPAQHCYVLAENSYSGPVAYCIETDVAVRTGNTYTSRGEDYWGATCSATSL